MPTTPRYGQTESAGQTNAYRNRLTNKPDPDDGSVYTPATHAQTESNGQSNANRNKATDRPDPDDGSVYTGVTPGLAFTTIENSDYVPHGGEYERDDIPAGTIDNTESPDGATSGSVYERPSVAPVVETEVRYFIESVPYPLWWKEDMQVAALITGNRLGQPYTVDTFTVSAALTAGSMSTLLLTYEDWPIESFSVNANLSSGILDTLLLTYEDWPIESFSVSANLSSGLLETLLIEYNNWPEESYSVNAVLTGGALV